MKGLALSELDQDIIRELQSDARMSFAEISEKLHTPASTVRHRINRLLKVGVLEFVAMSNPLKAGYPIWVMIYIQGEPHKIRTVATELTKIPEVYFVATTVGRYPLTAGAFFRSHDDLNSFLNERLGRMPGITEIQTSIVLEIFKRNMSLQFPAAESGKRKKPQQRSR